MPARGKVIGEFGAKAARGKIRETAHLIQRLIGRPGGDDAIHAEKSSRKGHEAHKKFFCRFVFRDFL
jgi:hypothetical protein